ncbi:hypothetical protein HYY69_02195 [Candidatus Woesearchaeota archaeon]|nr:hypothetical protein [Candidatus Woesearchaeota archaeon]
MKDVNHHAGKKKRILVELRATEEELEILRETTSVTELVSRLGAGLVAEITKAIAELEGVELRKQYTINGQDYPIAAIVGRQGGLSATNRSILGSAGNLLTEQVPEETIQKAGYPMDEVYRDWNARVRDTQIYGKHRQHVLVVLNAPHYVSRLPAYHRKVQSFQEERLPEILGDCGGEVGEFRSNAGVVGYHLLLSQEGLAALKAAADPLVRRVYDGEVPQRVINRCKDDGLKMGMEIFNEMASEDRLYQVPTLQERAKLVKQGKELSAAMRSGGCLVDV